MLCQRQDVEVRSLLLRPTTFGELTLHHAARQFKTSTVVEQTSSS